MFRGKSFFACCALLALVAGIAGADVMEAKGLNMSLDELRRVRASEAPTSTGPITAKQTAPGCTAVTFENGGTNNLATDRYRSLPGRPGS